MFDLPREFSTADLPDVIPLVCPQCNSRVGMKYPRGLDIYCEDCGWPDSDFDDN